MTEPINTPDPGGSFNVSPEGRARGDEPAELDPGMVERAGQSVRERLDTFWPELEDETPQTPDDGAIPEGLDDCAWDIARAALTAAGVPALVAEVERLRYDLDHSYSQREWSALTARATSAEQERDRLRAGIEVLAAEFDKPSPSTLAYRAEVARALRALLAGSGEHPGECENHGERANDGQAFCCGCGTCQATEHIHGCFADNGACEYPDDHRPAPVPPDSPDVGAAERITAYLDEMDRVDTANHAGSRYDDAVHSINDLDLRRSDLRAVLAVVGQGVTAEQAWDEGYRQAMVAFEAIPNHGDPACYGPPTDGPHANPYRAAVRPTGQEGS